MDAEALAQPRGLLGLQGGGGEPIEDLDERPREELGTQPAEINGPERPDVLRRASMVEPYAIRVAPAIGSEPQSLDIGRDRLIPYLIRLTLCG